MYQARNNIMVNMDTEGGSITFSEPTAFERPPDLRLIHYNDVYHVDASSAEPVGGVARFQTLCNYYKDDPKFTGQPIPITIFSGDAFNPSLESSVTKGMANAAEENTKLN
jgi:5'-nucleotidase